MRNEAAALRAIIASAGSELVDRLLLQIGLLPPP
jgi:hypothetical protein